MKRLRLILEILANYAERDLAHLFNQVLIPRQYDNIDGTSN